MKNAQPFDFQATLTRAESIICKIASQFLGNGSYRKLFMWRGKGRMTDIDRYKNFVI